jgi:hypothetical protein
VEGKKFDLGVVIRDKDVLAEFFILALNENEENPDFDKVKKRAEDIVLARREAEKKIMAEFKNNK